MEILILCIVVIVVLRFVIYSNTNNEESNNPIEEYKKIFNQSNLDGLGTGSGAKSTKDIPGGNGEFGMVKTNPIPLNGVPSIYQYLSELRYQYTSTRATVIYLPVKYKRTTEWDETDLGSSIEDASGVAAATSAPNILGNTDVFNIYDISGFKLAKIYLNGYQTYDSSKAPKGFFLASDVPDNQDSLKFMQKLENLPEDKKNEVIKESLEKMIENN